MRAREIITTMPLWLLGLALALAIVLVGPASAQDEAELATPIAADSTPEQDGQIERRLNNIYSHLDGLKAVTVTADAGVVTLQGEIYSRDNQEKALELAARTAGVVSVVDQLQYNRDLGRQIRLVGKDLRDRALSILQYLPILLLAALVFSGFWFLARWLTRDRSYLTRLAPNVFIGDLISQIVRIAITVLGLVVALQIADATSILGSVLGALGLAGLAFGFAIRDTVENYIASILLSLRQPFSPNDHVVIEGQEGLVLRLTSRATLLMSFDGNHIRIPNAMVYKGIIVNYTRNPRRRLSFELGVGSDVNLINALSLASATMAESPGVLAKPAPIGQVQALGDSNVLLCFHAWLDQTVSDYTSVRSETIRRVKAAFQQADFDMPEPIYRLNIQADAAATSPASGTTETTGEPTAEREPVQHTAQRQESPEDAVRAQLVVDREHEDQQDDLLSTDAPKE